MDTGTDEAGRARNAVDEDGNEAALSFDDLLKFATIDELEQLTEALLGGMLAPMLQSLLVTGKLDRGKLDDLPYVYSTFKANFRDLLSRSPVVYTVHEELVTGARSEYENDRPEAAVVLAATATEHIINEFLRATLEEHSGLREEEVIQVLRENTRTKTTWLLHLLTGEELSEALARRVSRLMEIRNSIVHYKCQPARSMEDRVDKPGLLRGRDDITDSDLAGLIAVPGDLRDELDATRKLASDSYRAASEVADAILERVRHTHAVRRAHRVAGKA